MPIPTGTYTAVARAFPNDRGVTELAQWGLSKKNNNKQIVIHFEIVQENCEQAGVVIPWVGTFTKNTTKRILESLRYCGWKGDDVLNLGALDQIVSIVVEHTDDGKYARVAWVNRIGGGRLTLQKPMDDAALRLFAASVRDYAARLPEVEGKRHGESSSNGQSASAEMPGYDDAPPAAEYDDVPF